MENGTFQFTFEPIYSWWLVAALAAITLASVGLTITMKELSGRGKLVLVALRLLATLVLLLGCLRPAFWTTSKRDTEGVIAVLMDRSQSMTLPSDSLGKSRWDAQHEVWDSIRRETDLRIGNSKLVPFFYDKELVATSEDALPSLEKIFKQQPEGRLTDLGQALSELNRQQVTPPLRGVVMMGDATQTLLPPQNDPLLAARQMAQLDQPILFVGIGSSGESSLGRDVAIETMPEEITAFAGKDVGVPVVLSATGLQNQPIGVTLTLKSGNKLDQVLHSRKVLASRPEEKIPLDFRALLAEPGDYLLVAEASVDTTEQITSNNQSMSFVTVREGGVRMLLLEGQPRYEQLYLKASIDASIDFDLEYKWLAGRNRKDWPIDLSRSIDFENFDVFIVGDLDSAALTEANWKRIASLVNQGAGLLLLGGYNSFDAGGYQESPLAPAIPIQMVRAKQQLDQRIDDRFHVQQPIRLVPTRPHPITSLLPEPDNTRLWERLKPMEGMNRFRGLSSAPGTQVLLSGPNDQPALVAGQFGRGRVLAFAADSTWQWYLAGDESGQRKAHQTFWRQAMLWLVNRDKLQEGFRLTIDSRRQDIDATPHIQIEWYGGSDQKQIPKDIKLSLHREKEFVRNLELAATGDSTLKTVVSGLDQPGLYRAALSAKDSSGGAYAAELGFLVRDASRELTSPAADWSMMANLVAAGSAAGSELFLPEETGKLVAKLKERQNAATITTIDRRRLGDAAWDSWLYFLLFCGLMTTEWALRKKWQLP